MARPASNRLSVVDDKWDPWELENGGYKIEGFYPGSTNKHDHSSMVHLKIAPHVHAKAMELVTQCGIPEYRTVQDFYRDAALHRMKWLAEKYKDADLLAFVDRQVTVAALDRINQQHAEWVAVIEQVTDTLKRLKDYGDGDSTAMLIDSMTPNIAIMREPYSTNLANVLDQYRTEPLTY